MNTNSIKKLAKDIISSAKNKTKKKSAVDFFLNNSGPTHGDLHRLLDSFPVFGASETSMRKCVKKWLTVENIFHGFVVGDWNVSEKLRSLHYWKCQANHPIVKDEDVIEFNSLILLRGFIIKEFIKTFGDINTLNISFSEKSWGKFRKNLKYETLFSGDHKSNIVSAIRFLKNNMGKYTEVKIHHVRVFKAGKVGIYSLSQYNALQELCEGVCSINLKLLS
jgi:hypothetical protein